MNFKPNVVSQFLFGMVVAGFIAAAFAIERKNPGQGIIFAGVIVVMHLMVGTLIWLAGGF